MKSILLAAIMIAATTQVLAADVGVSISVGQPGFYGHIDIGGFPRPQLVYRTPVIIQPVPVGIVRPAIYLHVPPGHSKNWRKHCYKYNACGQPVYFVQDTWYNDEYVAHYHQQHSRDHEDDHYEEHHHDEHEDRGHGKNKHKKAKHHKD